MLGILFPGRNIFNAKVFFLSSQAFCTPHHSRRGRGRRRRRAGGGAGDQGIAQKLNKKRNFCCAKEMRDAVTESKTGMINC